MLNILTGPGLFRLALALLVFVNHVSALALGGAAVFIFFILSGYWICTIWTAYYSKTHEPYVTYLVSRGWRLLPTFILCSAIAWMLLLLNGDVPPQINWPHQAISNLLFFGYNSLSFQPNGPAWSLDIEAQFYLLAPLLIILIRHSVWVLLGCLLFSFGAYLLNLTVTVAPYLVFFAIGVAAANVKWKPGLQLARGALGLTFALILVCIATPYKGVLLGGAHPGPLIVFNGAANVALALLMAPWVIYTTGQKGARPDRMLGDLSYIVYLLHSPVLGVIRTGDGSYLHRGLLIGEALGLVLFGSMLIWAVFDHPINRLRSKWVAARMRAGPSQDLGHRVSAAS